MQTISIKQDLIERLVRLDKKNKFLLSEHTTNADWATLKIHSQQDLDKWKKYLKVYEVLAYILMAITVVIAFLRFSDDVGPDLNKKSLFIFITVTNMFSAFQQRLRVERLEKQVLLLDLLEMADDKNVHQATEETSFS